MFPNRKRYGQKIGFLTSELKLEEFFTPNYLFDFFSNLHQVEPSVREQRKKSLFDRFGIGEFAEVKVANLSTGMKQKTSLAISLVHDPHIIIFDEPTNGLDVLTAKVVTDFLQELKQEGKTILVSTHIFSLIERICDRVGIIVDGRRPATAWRLLPPGNPWRTGFSICTRKWQVRIHENRIATIAKRNWPAFFGINEWRLPRCCSPDC